MSAVSYLLAVGALLQPTRVVGPRDPATIVGGHDVVPAAWRSVVAVDFQISLCTGTLTAAHCLYNRPPPQLVEIDFGDDSDASEESIVVESYELHPDFCANIFECEFDLYDFAYIILSDDAPDDIAPPVLLTDQETWDALMYPTARVTHVGFGEDERLEDGSKRMVEVQVIAFTDSGLEFFAGGEGHDGCEGDSGGPVFARLPDGTWVLVGVSSRGLSCGDGGFYGVVHPALCWIGEELGITWRDDDDECGGCGCIDYDPSRHGPGCAVAPARRGAPTSLMLIALALASRRRRATSRSSPCGSRSCRGAR